VKVSDDRKGLISIIVEYRNPKVAANIANEYTAALERFLNENALSIAKRNRIFLGKQLESTKVDLLRTEEDLKGYQTKERIVALDAQSEAAIKALAELKAQVIAREVQLAAWREFTTKANPDVKRMEDELRELSQQLKRLEMGSKHADSNKSIGAWITLNEAPAVGLGYVRLKRDALIQEKVFEFLTQQYEMAKVEEAHDDITFQVVDSAVAPQKKIKPKRALNVLIAGVGSLFLGILLVFLFEYLEEQKARQCIRKR
jgi:tyrosine-protein kinase Etk/Wzc